MRIWHGGFPQIWRVLTSSFWLALWLVCASLPLCAQRLPVRYYTTNDGLPSSFVQHLVIDSRGFVWACTRNGLSRFDGAEFFNYTTVDGLPHSTINDLLEARDGTYWVATNGGGVARFNPKRSTATETKSRFTVYQVGAEGRSNNVNKLFEDPQGRIWAGTDDRVFRLDPARGETMFSSVNLPVAKPDSGDLSVNAIVADRWGAVWVGFTNAGLLRVWPDGRIEDFTRWRGLPVLNVLRLLFDRDGNLWVGNFLKGLVRLQFDPLTRQPTAARHFTTADGLASHYVESLYQFADGRLWAAAEGGLSEFDGTQFKPLPQVTRLAGDGRAYSLAEDRAGNVWFRITGKGIAKLIGKGFSTWDQTESANLSVTYPLFVGEANELFANGVNWTLFRFAADGFTSVRLPMPPEARNYWLAKAAYRDRAGEWWVASSAGLFRFGQVSRFAALAQARPRAVYRKGNGLAHDGVSDFYEDTRGDLWITTVGEDGDNLVRWERASETFHPVKVPAQIPLSRIARHFAEDRAGNLWIGFRDGGAVRYHNGQFLLLQAEDGWPQVPLSDLYLDRAGRLWLAAEDQGLLCVDEPAAERPRVTRRYTMAEGLSSNNVRALIEDQWGRLYFGMSTGVNRLDLTQNTIRHFTAADGLSNEFVLTALRDARGHLWFGTIDGLSRLIPELDPPPAPPPVYISGLRIAGLPYGISELGETTVDGLRLSAAQNNLELAYFGFSFALGERLRFQYKLEGADHDWHAPSTQRQVNYANLAPGGYRFLVRALNADGVMSAAPASVSFTILPPLWRRWWFLTLAALALGGLIYAAYRYRLTQVLAVERVRMRIATDLHDDIGSNLTRIAMLSEVAQQQLHHAEPEVSERLTRVADISRESVDSLSDIVWAINPDKDKLSDLTQRMRRVADDLCAARDIEILFLAETEHDTLKLETDLRREVLLIFKECLNNAVRHSGCETVEVEFRYAEGELRLRVRDDGSGLTTEPNGNGHGLASMRQRAKRMGGQLELVAPNGHGTTVTVQVPLKKSHG